MLHQLQTTSHVRVHMSTIESTEEVQATEFRMQFISDYATPEATDRNYSIFSCIIQ